ncbi:MAG: YebC/PmpR family DNA-binding transcriptional regulator [Clostridia bacterium]|nr:YebC/PmpR family DNA-binding transcriptional regulator [Clostridia bacterium]MBQ9880295.1 YebC/PmpR family DNA-binding transcriptional regulator [Clostridia bacterium]MCR5689865.1 YebC/PmpR family DNA-binding transcriptional regulator [Clostridiales bacterium]
MSGHSKWNNIKRKKEKTDNARAAVFTKVGREIAVAVKSGGPDPAGNYKLAAAVAKAKAMNVPNDNIERIIKKAAGDSDSANYEEIVYEGYGPCGIAVIVETLTDNRNRTAGDVRHYFDKYRGNMGQSGSVMFMFSRAGVILVDREDTDEEKLMDDALNAGAEDILTDDEAVFEVRTGVNDVGAVSEELSGMGYNILDAGAQYIPSTTVKLTDPDDIKAMGRMLEAFEDNDDIQNVWHNWENEEDYEG